MNENFKRAALNWLTKENKFLSVKNINKHAVQSIN
jgi:hypothetical protein